MRIFGICLMIMGLCIFFNLTKLAGTTLMIYGIYQVFISIRNMIDIYHHKN